jgi:hypothetical protein
VGQRNFTTRPQILNIMHLQNWCGAAEELRSVLHSYLHVAGLALNSYILAVIKIVLNDMQTTPGIQLKFYIES